MINRSFFSNIPPVTKNLLILNIIVWAFMAITPESTSDKIVQLGALHYVSSHHFGIWQLLTYMFIHANFVHLFFNMWALLLFGCAIENAFGTRRYIFYYLSCGVGAAIVQLIVYAVMISNASSGMPATDYRYVLEYGWQALDMNQNFVNPAMANLNILINMPTVGASGAVFGILLAFGMLYPNIEMYIMFVPYPIKAKWMVTGYGVLELLLGLGGAADGVAHFAHLGGMLFGFVMIWYWRRQYRRNGRF